MGGLAGCSFQVSVYSACQRSFGFGRNHPDVFPDAPVDSADGVRPLIIAGVGKGVNEGTGAHVIHLTLRCNIGAGGGKQQHEIQRGLPEQFIQNQGAVEFGGENFLDFTLAL